MIVNSSAVVAILNRESDAAGLKPCAARWKKENTAVLLTTAMRHFLLNWMIPKAFVPPDNETLPELDAQSEDIIKDTPSTSLSARPFLKIL